MRRNRKRTVGPLDPADRDRLCRLAESGVEVSRLQWTFNRPIAELEAVVDAFRRERMLREAHSLAFEGWAEPPGPHVRAPSPTGDRALPLPPIERALAILGNRAAETRTGFEIDGRPVAPGELILAAQRLGFRIPYPGIEPLPRCYSTGPSTSTGR